MSQQFTFKEKLFGAKQYLDAKDKLKIRDDFIYQYSDRYDKSSSREREYAYRRLKTGSTKYNLGMSNLKSKTGKYATGRPTNEGITKKKRSIIELNENDLKVYEDIVDSLLKKKGLTKEDVMNELLKRKNKTDNKDAMSGVFGINRKVFYRVNTGRNMRRENSELEHIIEDLGKEYRKIHGYEKLYHILVSWGFNVSKGQVRKSYENLNVKSIRFNRFVKRPKESKNTKVKGENLVGENYIGERPNQKGFTDVSYIRLKTGRYIYLSLIIDSFSNKVLNGELSFQNDTQLAYSTLINAIRKYGKPQIIHNDHGSPYLSKEFIRLCSKLEIRRSLSGVGISLDNRPAEFIFGLIKHEHLLHQELDSIETAYNELDDYIKFYNQSRIQSNLKNMSPEQYLSTYS